MSGGSNNGLSYLQLLSNYPDYVLKIHCRYNENRNTIWFASLGSPELVCKGCLLTPALSSF